MEKLIVISDARKDEIILQAIEKLTPCVLTRRRQRGWQLSKSRLVGGNAAEGRLLLSAGEGSELADQDDFAAGEQVGVTFRRGHKKCLCATTVIGYTIMDGGGEQLPCVELVWPDGIQELQRRVYYRAEPPGRRIHVRFWPGGIAARADAERDGCGVMSGVLLDLSAGGMRIKTTDVAPDAFIEGDPVGCAFSPKPRGETLILDGAFRHYQPDDDGVCSIGVQFVGLEATERGRETLAMLARVVTDFQRTRSRQQRMRLVGR